MGGYYLGPIAELQAIVDVAASRNLAALYFEGGAGCDLAIVHTGDGRAVIIDNWTVDSNFHATVCADWETALLAEDPEARNVNNAVPEGTPAEDVLDSFLAQVATGQTWKWGPGKSGPDESDAA